jgi:hypothetical protein
VLLQDRGKGIDLVEQFPVGDLPALVGLRAFPDDGDVVARAGKDVRSIAL